MDVSVGWGWLVLSEKEDVVQSVVTKMVLICVQLSNKMKDFR